MNGIETITARISAETEAEIRAIEETAQAQAAELKQQYEREANARASEIKEKGKQSAAQRRERLTSASKMERKKMLLAVKQTALDEAFQKALLDLTNLPENEYVALLTELAMQSVRTGREQLILSPSDRTRFGKKVVTAVNQRLEQDADWTKDAALTLSETTRAIKGGIILSDGKTETNGSFETILRLLRKGAAGQVASLLFD